MIESGFHGVVGAKAVGPSGHHSDFVVEALDGAVGDFTFGPEPIEDEFLVRPDSQGGCGSPATRLIDLDPP